MDATPASLSAPPTSSPVPVGRIRHAALWAALVGLLAFWVHAETLTYALTGFDTYPLILTSRVESVSDILDTFAEPMMEGRYPGGDFYRPTQQVLLALEGHLFGLQSAGYQFNSLLLYCATVLLTFGAAWRWGERSCVGPVVAASVLALHPSLLSVVPVVSRRVELYTIFFVLLSLLLFNRTGRKPTVWSLLATSVVGFLALGSKETGILLFPMAVVQLMPPNGSFSSARRAGLLKGSGALAVSLLAYLALRTVALWHTTDGPFDVGGHHAGLPFTQMLPLLLEEAARHLFLPWAIFPTTADSRTAIGLLLLIATLVIGSVIWFMSTSRNGSQLRGAGALARMGVGWFGMSFVLTAFAGKFNPRYVPLMLVGVGLIWGAGAQWVLAWVAESPPAASLSNRVLIAGVGAATAVCVGASVWVSPAWTEYPEWRGASDLEFAFLDDLEEHLERSGAAVTYATQAPFMPIRGVHPPLYSHRPRVENAVLLADWSLQAWAELRFPSRNIRVVDTRFDPTRSSEEGVQYVVFGWNPKGPQWQDLQPFAAVMQDAEGSK